MVTPPPLNTLQESSERDVLHGLTGRIDQLLDNSRKSDWTPSEPLPSAQSPWVNALLSYLQVRGWVGSCVCEVATTGLTLQGVPSTLVCSV